MNFFRMFLWLLSESVIRNSILAAIVFISRDSFTIEINTFRIKINLNQTISNLGISEQLVLTSAVKKNGDRILSNLEIFQLNKIPTYLMYFSFALKYLIA